MKKKFKKIEVWCAKKGNWKAKKDDFSVTILGSFFKSGMGRLSKSMEQYTPLEENPDES